MVKTKTKAILGITVALVAVLFAAYFALTCPRVLVSFTVSFTIGAMLGVKNLKSISPRIREGGGPRSEGQRHMDG